MCCERVWATKWIELMSGGRMGIVTGCSRPGQTLLMEIPCAPSRSGFRCRDSGLLVPPLPLGREEMAGNCWAFCVTSPLRMEHSDWSPLWGQMPSFTKMSRGALAMSLSGVLLCCIRFLSACFTTCPVIPFNLDFLPATSTVCYLNIQYIIFCCSR